MMPVVFVELAALVFFCFALCSFLSSQSTINMAASAGAAGAAAGSSAEEKKVYSLSLLGCAHQPQPNHTLRCVSIVFSLLWFGVRNANPHPSFKNWPVEIAAICNCRSLLSPQTKNKKPLRDLRHLRRRLRPLLRRHPHPHPPRSHKSRHSLSLSASSALRSI